MNRNHTITFITELNTHCCSFGWSAFLLFLLPDRYLKITRATPCVNSCCKHHCLPAWLPACPLPALTQHLGTCSLPPHSSLVLCPPPPPTPAQPPHAHHTLSSLETLPLLRKHRGVNRASLAQLRKPSDLPSPTLPGMCFPQWVTRPHYLFSPWFTECLLCSQHGPSPLPPTSKPLNPRSKPLRWCCHPT